jgi:hypothetical protein
MVWGNGWTSRFCGRNLKFVKCNGRKLAFIIFIGLSIVLSGCIPLRQQALVKGSPDVDLLLCDDRYLLLTIGHGDMPNDHKIIIQQSYIQSPKGTRYSIQIEPHQFDIEKKFIYLRDDVYPCDASGSRLRHWSNGIWLVHLVVQTNGELSTFDQQLKFWTFYYNPIIHGPPN